MKNRRDFFKLGLMGAVGIAIPNYAFTDQPMQAFSSGLKKLPNYKFSIVNTTDKDLNVFLCNYKNRSYLERYAIRDIAKKHSSPFDYIIHGHKPQQKILCLGADELFDKLNNNSFIIKDMFVRANILNQLETTMKLWTLRENSVYELTFSEFYTADQTTEDTIGVRSFNYPMTSETLLAFEMKAGCSLYITFIYED